MEFLLWTWSQCIYILVCTLPRVESLFPSVLWSSFTQPYCLQSQVLWGSLLQIPDPQAGKPDMGLRALTHVGEPVIQLFSNVWVTHSVGMEFAYTAKAPLIPSHFGFFFVFGYTRSFLVGSSLFCQWLFRSCDFVFMKGG